MKSLSWQEFWHIYGNKYPLKPETHRLALHPYPGCFYCMLEEKAEVLLFGNDGVIILERLSGIRTAKAIMPISLDMPKKTCYNGPIVTT